MYVFGICETYLNDSITNDKIEIEVFPSKPYMKDCKEANIHPRGGVWLYFKENIPIIEREDLTKDIGECIVSEIYLKNKKIFFFLIYRSPSQSSLEFDKFMNNFWLKLIMKNPLQLSLRATLTRDPPFLGRGGNRISGRQNACLFYGCKQS